MDLNNRKIKNNPPRRVVIIKTSGTAHVLSCYERSSKIQEYAFNFRKLLCAEHKH